MSWISDTWNGMKQQNKENIERWATYPVVGPVVKVGEGAVEVVKGAASFTVWINQHWQLAIVGIVALVLLLKD